MARSRGARGFSVPELMIVLAMLGIVAAIAYPSFTDALRKGRRSEGMQALALVQQGEERFRSSNATYGDSTNFASWGVTATTSSGYYSIAVGGVSATGYTATATAVAGTSQANDTNCTVLGVRMAGGNLSYGGGASIDWTAANPDPNRCWAR
ncbi:MAG: type IV pilin protein [Rubrivivax sp.]